MRRERWFDEDLSGKGGKCDEDLSHWCDGGTLRTHVFVPSCGKSRNEGMIGIESEKAGNESASIRNALLK